MCFRRREAYIGTPMNSPHLLGRNEMLRIAVVPLFVAMFCSTLSADHHQEAAKLMKYYGWWDGTWKVTIKDGETSTMTITRPKADCHLVKDASFGVSQ